MTDKGHRVIKRWREVAGYVWEREPIVILLGLLATLLAAPLSVPLLLINACMVVLLGYKLYRTTRQADRLLREKHLPVVVLVGKGEDVANSDRPLAGSADRHKLRRTPRGEGTNGHAEKTDGLKAGYETRKLPGYVELASAFLAEGSDRVRGASSKGRRGPGEGRGSRDG